MSLELRPLSVSVVVPSWHYWMNPLKLQPLWELYYATLIETRVPAVDVKLIDLREDEAQTRPVPDVGSDVYFYWVMKSADALEVYDIVAKLRASNPRAIHIAGGTHVDHHLEECSRIFDAALQGTAEESIVQAFLDLRAGSLAKTYRSSEILPFTNYGHAKRHFLPAHRVVNHEHFGQHGGQLGTGVYFSRGCSFSCRFCVYNNPAKFEYRAGAQITAEIEYLKANYRVEGVNLRDEVCIPVNPKVARDYLEGIGRGGVVWRGQTVPFGREEIVQLAKESGCLEVALGIESVDSDLVLEISNKPSKSISENRKYIELLKKHGIKVKACLIMGLPGESKHVLERTVKFLDEVQPDYVAVSGFDPVPGSVFFREPEKFGIKRIDRDLSKHAHLVYRFGDEEEVGLPFEYEKEGPWGPTLSREEIVHNIKTVQAYLRDRQMSY